MYTHVQTRAFFVTKRSVAHQNPPKHRQPLLSALTGASAVSHPPDFDRTVAWEHLSKAELVALAVQYSKVIGERLRELEVLERRLAEQQSKGK